MYHWVYSESQIYTCTYRTYESIYLVFMGTGLIGDVTCCPVLYDFMSTASDIKNILGVFF